ncbi:MAG TPA: MarR family transcriptional regulator [Gaiellaceae bacterium]|jgi:DNA-binding MarR family transcriptional regulator|nr:MarR family transcriptional regulator [Gaiellaceae bacterium]
MAKTRKDTSTAGSIAQSAAEQLAAALEELVVLLIRQRVDATDSGGPSSLTATQQLALTLIEDEGPLRLHPLAERLNTSDATATRAVDTLEQAGLVRRLRDPDDGRGVLVSTTQRGRDAVAARRRHLIGTLEEGVSGLTAHDAVRLAQLLGELNRLLDDHGLPLLAIDA